MAIWKISITMAIMLVPIFLVGVSAQSNCPMALTSLSPCLTISTGNVSTPSSSCCSELANLAQTAPLCLCDLLNIGNAQVLGFVLNRTLPSSIPGACNVQIPLMSQCDGQGSQGTQGSEEGAYSKGTLLKMPWLLAILVALLAFYTPFPCEMLA